MSEHKITTVFKQAIEAHKAGKMKDANRLYTSILKTKPQHPDANHNLGLLKVRVGKVEEALAFFKTALEANFNSAQFWSSYIDCNIRLERFEEAKALLSSARAKGAAGDAFDQLQERLDVSNSGPKEGLDQLKNALRNLVMLHKRGELQRALDGAINLLKQFPDLEALHIISAEIHSSFKNYGAAVVSYKRALKISPDRPETHNNMGIALKNHGKLDEAIASYKKGIKIQPGFAQIHSNMGNALQDQDKLGEAIASYQQALKIDPEGAEVYSNLGITFQKKGDLEAAIESYNKALEKNPGLYEAYNNMGAAFQDKGDYDAAIESYDRALRINPDYASAYNNMGNALRDQGKLTEAILAYEQAIEIQPGHADAFYNKGNAFRDQGKFNKACEAYEQALKIEPDNEVYETDRLFILQNMCNFSNGNTLENASATLGIQTGAVPTFPGFSWADNPAEQLARSHKWMSEKIKTETRPLPRQPNKMPKRLRIGYISADFKIHPVAYLTLRLFELHDRSKFEVFGYSISGAPDSEMRKKIINSFDGFRDLSLISNKDAAEAIRKDQIDILIDLTGFTKDNRAEILALRAAPIQINYLGYPGSLGADFIDYMIADPVLVPEEHRLSYSEKIIYLPHTYQPTDDMRTIAKTTTTRTELGLPEDAFVFCCFNNNYKISRREFDIWMQLLSKVDDSVLWLIKPNKWARQNLCNEAEKRGVASTRLVFANKLPQSEHLARHKHADLFVDTFNYNAHTTASDALWAGLPLVTKKGNQFAARVAASILTAVGLPELITETEDNYERLILELATDTKKLYSIRSKLAKNLLQKPLFDTKRYTLNFEAGLIKAYDLYFNDQKPKDIWVQEGGV